MVQNYDGSVRGFDVNGNCVGGFNGCDGTNRTDDVEGYTIMGGTMATTNGAGAGAGTGAVSTEERWKSEQRRREPARPGAARAEAAADRWAEEQMFEEDVRAVLSMMRPNRRERLLGWSEYRTGGAHFRVTVSWDEEFEVGQAGPGRTCAAGKTRIPHLADVLEAVLVGSALHDDDLTAAEEFDLDRGVLREVYRRLDDLQACYE